MFARAVLLAVILRPGRCLLADPDASLIQISAASDPDPGARARPHRRRRALVPSLAPTRFPSLAPTAAPTASPTPAPEPGVACPCIPAACFEAYDRDGDLCLSSTECEQQVPLRGKCSSPAWDLDGNGCVDYSVEWPHVFELTNGSVCPVDGGGNDKIECDPGWYLDGYPTKCLQCIGGSTRRRRSFECSDCALQDFDAGDFDFCVRQADSYLSERNIAAGSMRLQVSSPFNLVAGDNITISNLSENTLGPTVDCDLGSRPRTTSRSPVDCSAQLAYEYAEIDSIIGPWITLKDGLKNTYAKYSSVMVSCTTTDGTELSRKHSNDACRCGTATCNHTSMCSISANGIGTCLPVGAYPIHPTPAPTVGAKGDPHLVNLLGEHFDINHGGDFTLLRIPQEPARAVEVQLQATIESEFGKPCATYITRAEVSGPWLGNASVQVRSYLRPRPGRPEGARLGARLLPPGSDAEEVPWQSIEAFLPDAPELDLSAPGSEYRVTLSKSQWSPRKEVVKGAPTVAGMFTLSMRHESNPEGSRILIRQDLPEQEHLNLAIQRVSALGRVDVGGLLGFDAHPESLEDVSGKCELHRLRDKPRIESQDEQDGAYYYRPLWKDKWSKIKQRRHGGGTTEDGHENEAAATLIGSRAATLSGSRGSSSNLMCKCPATGGPLAEGVVIEEAATMFAAASWD